MGKGHHADNTTRHQQKFKGWLSLLFPSVLEVQDDTALWHLRGDDGQGNYIDVAQPLERAQMVVIQVNVALLGSVKRQLSDLHPLERKHFICDLRLQILSFDVGFQGIADPLDIIMLTKGLFLDTVTRDLFLQSVTTIDRARHAALTILERFNDGAPGTTLAGSPSVS